MWYTPLVIFKTPEAETAAFQTDNVMERRGFGTERPSRVATRLTGWRGQITATTASGSTPRGVATLHSRLLMVSVA